MASSRLDHAPERQRLLRAEGWAITLYLEVASGFELPIYLLEARRP